MLCLAPTAFTLVTPGSEEESKLCETVVPGPVNPLGPNSTLLVALFWVAAVVLAVRLTEPPLAVMLPPP